MVKIGLNLTRGLFGRFQVEKNPKFNSIRTLLFKINRFFSNNDLSKHVCLISRIKLNRSSRRFICILMGRTHVKRIHSNRFCEIYGPQEPLCRQKVLISLSRRFIRSHLGSFTVILPSGQEWPSNGQFILYF